MAEMILTHCGDCGYIHTGACTVPRTQARGKEVNREPKTSHSDETIALLESELAEAQARIERLEDLLHRNCTFIYLDGQTGEKGRRCRICRAEKLGNVTAWGIIHKPDCILYRGGG